MCTITFAAYFSILAIFVMIKNMSNIYITMIVYDEWITIILAAVAMLLCAVQSYEYNLLHPLRLVVF